MPILLFKNLPFKSLESAGLFLPMIGTILVTGMILTGCAGSPSVPIPSLNETQYAKKIDATSVKTEESCGLVQAACQEPLSDKKDVKTINHEASPNS